LEGDFTKEQFEEEFSNISGSDLPKQEKEWAFDFLQKKKDIIFKELRKLDEEEGDVINL